MWQIKVFESDTVQGLEASVNEWLNQKENRGVELSQMAQSESIGGNFPWSITLTLLYKPVPKVL